MTCADVHTQILEAERTPIQVRAHALHCPDCATLVSAVEAETSDFADAVHAFEMAVPFDHAWDMASAKLNQRPAPPRAFDRRFHITAALVAAAAVFALAVWPSLTPQDLDLHTSAAPEPAIVEVSPVEPAPPTPDLLDAVSVAPDPPATPSLSPTEPVVPEPPSPPAPATHATPAPPLPPMPPADPLAPLRAELDSFLYVGLRGDQQADASALIEAAPAHIEIINDMARVLERDHAGTEVEVAAIYLRGRALLHHAHLGLSIQPPEGLREEEQWAYLDVLEAKVFPQYREMHAQSLEVLQEALDRGQPWPTSGWVARASEDLAAHRAEQEAWQERKRRTRRRGR